MKLTYSQATVGFCRDLTDPSCQPIPLAVVVIGKSESGGFAGVGYRLTVELDLDPISRAVLEDVPALLKAYLDRTLDSIRPDTDLTARLHGLHSSLRNSLSVLTVSAERELEVPEEPAEAASQLLMEAVRGFGSAQRKLAPPRAAGSSPMSNRPRRRDVIDAWESGRDSVPCSV
ncbi:MAG: hypothetical protein IPM35_20055 [Myxococcales bacterium]|nr:hypothetical protein [Myxococcales bacterium]